MALEGVWKKEAKTQGRLQSAILLPPPASPPRLGLLINGNLHIYQPSIHRAPFPNDRTAAGVA